MSNDLAFTTATLVGLAIALCLCVWIYRDLITVAEPMREEPQFVDSPVERTDAQKATRKNILELLYDGRLTVVSSFTLGGNIYQVFSNGLVTVRESIWGPVTIYVTPEDIADAWSIH